MTNGTLDPDPHLLTEIALVRRVQSVLTIETLVENLRSTFLNAQQSFQRRLIFLRSVVVCLMFEGQELE